MTLLVDSTIKVSLILLVAFGAAAMLRRRSAALRHAVLAAAVVCALATPALRRVAPAWHVGLRPAAARVLDPAETIAITPLGDVGGAAVDSRREAPKVRSLASLLAWTWAAGVLVNVGLLTLAIARLKRAAIQRPDDPSSSAVSAIAAEYGIRRRVRLERSERSTLLATWGLWRPTIILPAAAQDWTPERMRIVLAHELAHIRRVDWAVQMLAEILRAIYWFNPLAWMASRRLRQESEQACDDAVLALGVEGATYATHLVEVARDARTQTERWTPALAMARRSSLERRVRAMLNSGLNRAPMTRAAAAATLVLLAVLTVAVAGFGAQGTSASLAGSLVDPLGRILPDAPLALTSVATKQRLEARSDQEGRFLFIGLAPGEYELEAKRLGFTSLNDRVRLADGQHLDRRVVLEVGSIQETIRVTPAATQQTVREARVPPPPAPAAPAGGQLQAPAPPPPPAPPAKTRGASACDQSPVGGCIDAPTKVKDVRPRYPDAHRESGTSGLVYLQALIGVDGAVKSLSVVGPADADFGREAMSAVSQWRFTPTRLDGVPIDVRMNVSVSFDAER